MLTNMQKCCKVLHFCYPICKNAVRYCIFVIQTLKNLSEIDTCMQKCCKVLHFCYLTCKNAVRYCIFPIQTLQNLSFPQGTQEGGFSLFHTDTHSPQKSLVSFLRIPLAWRAAGAVSVLAPPPPAHPRHGSPGAVGTLMT